MSIKQLYSEIQAAEQTAYVNHESDWGFGLEELKDDNLLETELNVVVASMEALLVGVHGVDAGGISELSSRMIVRSVNTIERRLTGAPPVTTGMEDYADPHGELVASQEAWVDVKRKALEIWKYVLKQIMRFYELVKSMISNMFRGKEYVSRRIATLKEKVASNKGFMTAKKPTVRLSTAAINVLRFNGSLVKPNELNRAYLASGTEVITYGKILVGFSNDLCEYVSRSVAFLRQDNQTDRELASWFFAVDKYGTMMKHKSPAMLGDVSFTPPVVSDFNPDDKSQTITPAVFVSPTELQNVINDVPGIDIAIMPALLKSIEDFNSGRDQLERALSAGNEARNKSARQWDAIMRATGGFADKVKYSLPVTRVVYRSVRANNLRAVLQSLTHMHTATIHMLAYIDRSLSNYAGN